MKQPTKTEQWAAAWEQAVERATDAARREPELSDMLHTAAGIHLKSGVKAGLWGTTASCPGDRTYSCRC